MGMSKITLISTVLFLVVIILITFQAVFNASPIVIGKYFSAVGVTVGVAPNPFNTLAQQLKEKEFALADREKELQQEEAALGEKIDKKFATQNKNFLYLLTIGGILVTLILFNFYFDRRHRSG